MTDTHRMLPQSMAGWGGLAAFLVVLALLPLYVPTYYVGLITTAMIGAMLALSMHLLVGATGLVSLGHGAFYGLAAYVVYLVTPADTPSSMWLTLPLAMTVSGLVAVLVGVLSLRTSGFFFLMVTLAFGQMIYFVFHDTKLGGGTDGAYLAKPLFSAFGWALDPKDFPRARRSWPPYYVALGQLVVTYLILVFLLRSLFGRVLEGIKVNEHRMIAMGFNTNRYKLAAFVIAAMLAAAAGHMLAMQTGFVNPDLVSWHKSAEALLMILLGGIGSLTGAVVGAFAYYALGEGAQVLGSYVAAWGFPKTGEILKERKLLVEGLVILTVVLVARNGLTGIRLFGASKDAPRTSPSDGHAATSSITGADDKSSVGGSP
jgi:branched-chain amino acid transport system permease protein